MSLLEQQQSLEKSLETLHKERIDLTRQIVKKRKELDKFEKKHGNIIFKEKRRQHWEQDKIVFAEKRKDPEWQKWHKEFMSSRK